MPTRPRLLVPLGLAALVVAFAGIPAAAETTPTGGPNQLVLSSATAEGSWQVRSGTQLATFGGDTWTSANIARAISLDCTGCHATAVAVQVILVTGSPSYAAPANVASATNAACTGCGSYAYAWQYWVFTGGPAHLSAAGHQRVAELRSEIADAAASILPSDRITDPCFTEPPFPCTPRNLELDAKLNALTAQLRAVIDSELQAAGVSATGFVERTIHTSPGL